MPRRTDAACELRDNRSLKPRILRHRAAWLLAPLGVLVLLVALAALLIAIFGWNWARAPLQRAVLAQTGRALLIDGDLSVHMGWPALRVRAERLSFANPAWAQAPAMLTAAAADVTLDLPVLLQRRVLLPTVHLRQPVVMLETAPDGRKSWLLDLAQSDEDARVRIGLLTLDQGEIGYDDVRLKTQVRAALHTAPDGGGVNLTAKGRYLGLPLQAQGQGGPVLALRDENAPYPLTLQATVGGSGLRAKGTITGLQTFRAVDLRVAFHGDSLALLFPLIGVGLPETPSYVTAGQLVRQGRTWRYDNFTGRIGRSDVAGSLQVVLDGVRPLLRGQVVSQVLNIADLGPAIGAGPVTTAAPVGPHRVLPELPFKTDRWRVFDADVTLRALRIVRDKALPLDKLQAHVRLQDAVLTLDPLEFGVAGGRLAGTLSLDARQAEIQARARLQAQKIQLNPLFPTLPLTQSSVGQISGTLALAGRGNAVGRMLATADGQVQLAAGEGRISRLLMERSGLHLLEILQLTLTGDKPVVLRCAKLDFAVAGGVMTARTLLLDTDVSTVNGSGTVNLAQETLDLRLVPRTRKTSLVALRTPILVTGTLGAPVVSLDKERLLARGAGAVALGLLNPLLALIPLIEPGPGVADPCTVTAPAAPDVTRAGGQTPK